MEKKPVSPKIVARQKRLAKALKRNLVRRKEQVRKQVKMQPPRKPEEDDAQ